MQDKNGWISKTGWATDGWGEGYSSGVEGIRTGGCLQSTGDLIEVIDGL